jgi:small subunit ribosomal protein S1
MAQSATATAIPAELMKEDFASLLEESFKTNNPLQGAVLKGRVIGIEKDQVVIDVGLKSEGRVSTREFATPGKDLEIKVGDVVDVFLERLEDREGNVVLSREKARREESWLDLDRAFQKAERVNGIIYSRVKGGFTVDLGGATAFLPGSQVDIRPVKDVGPLMGTPQPFMILKMDRARGNIVVSRRAVLRRIPRRSPHRPDQRP